MINRELQLSRGHRVALGLSVWAIVASFGVYQYRTAARKTAEILASANARSEGLEALMADDHFGVITVDETFQITDFNPGAELLTGVSEEIALRHNVSDIVCGELADVLREEMAERRANPKTARVRVINCDMVGEETRVRCRVCITETIGGKMLGVILVDPTANVKHDQ